MPSATGKRTPPPPWDQFLGEVDRLIPEPVELHCVGGFVIAACYGLARPTADVDYITVRPSGASVHLLQTAGLGSKLHKKYKLYLQQVGVANCPENYEDRLIEMYPGHFRNLRLFALDPYDLALSKLERNAAVDREDVAYLAKQVPLDFRVLEQRYREELRPHLSHQDRHDLTLELWREACFSPGS